MLQWGMGSGVEGRGGEGRGGEGCREEGCVWDGGEEFKCFNGE